MNEIEKPNGAADRPEVVGFLRGFMAKALPTAPSEEDIHIPFLEMGANSLVLMEVQRAVETRFGLTITIPQFFEELTSIDALANFIVEYQVVPEVVAEVVVSAPVEAPVAAPVAAVAPLAAPPVVSSLTAPSLTVPLPAMTAPQAMTLNAPAGELESILLRQIESASRAINQVVAQQLQFLGDIGVRSEAAAPAAPVPPAPAPTPAPTSATPVTTQPTVATKPAAATKPSAAAKPAAAVMHRMLSPLEIRARGLNAKQQTYLEALIQRYTERTKKSKELAAHYRGVLADSRAAVGFRFTTKEMLYPITGKRAQGAKIWDIDGNEYIDITMGQGVTLFGHRPEFIAQALADADNDILLLGPRPPQTGEAAALICELTGMERVTFTNSGTEAVMAALRIARAATKRNKIVMFDNAYHGHSDNVMGRPVWQEDDLISVPVAPGIMQGAVDDLWLLDYGSESALDFIRAHIAEIAVVVVEPVQSRRPDLQPREFLHELRRITEAGGALLMFDEMITGFRVHPGGAQAWFDVKADIATYGKVLAGGLPIGVVAGAARYMDAIDGGMWQYGDASYPLADRTIFGGTFCQHPAAMITTLATLRYLKEQGPALQQNLNRRTDRLAAELNDFFDLEEVPIKVVHFASLFRFSFSTNLEFLFYQMMEKGVFIWEWRNYFLSTAHSDADVDHIVQAVKECVFELRAGGFLPERSVVDASAVQSYPLSPAQKQLAVLAQISPQGSMAYHVSPLLRLQGADFQVAALRIAVRDVMRRHEALRTVIAGEVQRVLPLDLLPGAGLTYLDLTTATDVATAFATAQAEHATHVFDLARGPLFEAHLYKVAADDYRLLLKAHHIVVDGMSMNVIVQDLATFYTAAVRGISAELPPAPQFKDYLQWREAHSFPQQRDYWLQQLSGHLPALDLPVDHAETQIKSFRGGRYSCDIPATLLNGVRALSRAQGCTHFMTLFSAYALWLHRLCAQDELLVGMPVAGRKMEQSDALVAYCTHLIPIRSRVEWQQSFVDYLKTMRGTLLQGYQHQDYPFAELIEQPALKALRGNFVAALFNLDRPGEAPDMAGLQVDWLTQPIHHTAFAITLNLTEVGDDMVLECDYASDLFEGDSIARYVGHFLTLLDGIVAHPEQTLAQLPLLNAAAQQQLLVDWNDTRADYASDTCAHQLFEAQVAQAPDAVALSYGDQSMTYAELNQQANRLAVWLQGQGVGKSVGAEAVVGVCAERSPELVIGLLAILKAGGAYLPLDPSYPPSRLNFMLQDAGVKVVLTQERLLNALVLPAGAKALCLDTTLPQLELNGQIIDAAAVPQNTASAHSLAYLIYTSGSTGQPKGTLIEQRGLTNYLTWAVRRYEVLPGNAVEQGGGSPLHSSISFDATITSLFAPLISGKALTLVPEGGQEIDHIRAALQAGPASGKPWSLVKLTPAHLELLNALIPPEQLAGLTRYVVLGGEALLERHVAPWLEHAPETHLINEYGPTETVVGCCVFEAGDEVTETGNVAGSVPIGKPIANTQLYVLDAYLQPVPIGVKGELFIGGDGVARGYHQRPELTAERFIDIAQTGIRVDLPTSAGRRLYRTGDVVRYLADGNLVYFGRADHQVKVRGFRVELGEIESALAHLPGVREAVVLAQRRSEQDIRLVAYVTAVDAQTALDERALKAALAESLPAHMLPNTFMLLPAMPLTSNGKIDRAALPAPEGLRPNLAAAFVDPSSYAEKRIAAVWCELLQVEKVGADDNFFELGGHSLLVLPLSERLQSMFVRPISPVDIFRLPTVASQARYFSQTTAEAATEADNARSQAQRQRDALRQMKDKMKDKRQKRG